MVICNTSLGSVSRPMALVSFADALYLKKGLCLLLL